MNIIFNFCPY